MLDCSMPSAATAVMLDNGTQGDVTAGDGTYTGNQLGADYCAALGPWTVRVKAEVRDSAIGGTRRRSKPAG